MAKKKKGSKPVPKAKEVEEEVEISEEDLAEVEDDISEEEMLTILEDADELEVEETEDEEELEDLEEDEESKPKKKGAKKGKTPPKKKDAVDRDALPELGITMKNKNDENVKVTEELIEQIKRFKTANPAKYPIWRGVLTGTFILFQETEAKEEEEA